jgi:phospholipid/cholesterol/gamma-HCH transport system ATP-binding protein
MLFQAAALFESLNVGENVAFGLKRRTDLDPAAIGKIVADSLAKVGLSGIEGLMPYELSGGMRKRVGLARAIAYRPEIILYDEPSTGLDPIRADAINDLILLLQKEMGVTSIVITHDLVSAYKVADRMAMLYDGRIVAVGTPDEIRKSPDPVVQQFLLGRADGPIKNW